MDDQVKRLVDKVWQAYQSMPLDKRLIIGIAGIPGSGKTTISQILVDRLNALAAKSKPEAPAVATFVPMDGFHLTRAALSAMPDPEHAHARRGAAFTFDAAKFLDLVKSLRRSPATGAVLAPSFDHAVKDPKEDDISVLPTHRIVVLEGNYVALDGDVWREAAALLDELWFVDVDFDVARKRLRERHVKAGIAKDLEAADKRVTENDLVNGDEIVKRKVNIDEVIQSKEDASWVHE